MNDYIKCRMVVCRKRSNSMSFSDFVADEEKRLIERSIWKEAPYAPYAYSNVETDVLPPHVTGYLRNNPPGGNVRRPKWLPK